MIPLDMANCLLRFPIQRTGILYFFITFLFVLQSCSPDPDEGPKQMQCNYEELSGNYIFFSETDTSEQEVEFYASPDGFETTGISGYAFWYPASPLSGHLDNCNIILNTYTNVRRLGLPSPGGNMRYYYESMTGHGQFFPDNDSIMLFIHYTRTENFSVDFSGNLFFKKIN